MKFKQFRSTGKDIRVVSTSGHVGLITSEFTPLPSVLWAEAYASGAVAEDMKVDNLDTFVASKKKEKEDEELKERLEIKAILKNVFANPIGYLDAKNNLVFRKVIGLVGKPVKKELVDSIWDEVVSESEG